MGKTFILQNVERMHGLDVLRGMVIFLMIFCNYGFAGSPAWLRHHTPYDADGITLVDMIFPAFLFCMGASIPAAYRKYAAQPWIFFKHVWLRGAALVAMGLLCVNTPGTRLGIPGVWWQTAVSGAILLTWHRAVPGDGGRAGWRLVSRILRWTGIGFLLVYAVIFRSPENTGWAISWWGILGIIGWSYLVAALAYMIFRKTPELLFFLPLLLLGIYIAGRCGRFEHWGWLANRHTIVGSHPAIAVMGTALGGYGALFRERPGVLLRHFLGFIGLAAAAGWCFSVLWGVNKNDSTPAWCLYAAAATAAGWLATGILCDTLNFHPRVVGWLERLGQAALTAYILHIFLEQLVIAAGWRSAFLQPGVWWPAAGAAVTLTACWLCCAWTVELQKRRITLKI